MRARTSRFGVLDDDTPENGTLRKAKIESAVKMVLTAEGTGLEHFVEGTIDLG